MAEARAIFRDRADAGRKLAALLQHLKGKDPVVLALPRGGVAIGREVARALGAPLDIVLVRKIGVPWQPELALGAVSDGVEPQIFIDARLQERLAIPEDFVREETARQLAELERRRRVYCADRPPVTVDGRTAIVVDDGIATGGTIKAALQGISRHRPARLVLAVPVAPAESLPELAAQCDDIECLATPEPFCAVGAHYRDFTQTDDEEVIRLLVEARRWQAAPTDPEAG
jgi:putative phosphoribosyl transferase